MTTESATLRGQLCIWTDVDPAHDEDFNRWYDREHMQERVAIPGFQSARRFCALGAAPRPYLALYDTENLEVFRSAAYRSAFANQTEWSLHNFARMRDTQRRVGELAIELGDGEGGALALFVVPAGQVALEILRVELARVREESGVVRAAVLCTDVGLSSPLIANAPPAAADALVTIESTCADSGLAQARALAAQLGLPTDAVHSFRTMWRLGA